MCAPARLSTMGRGQASIHPVTVSTTADDIELLDECRTLWGEPERVQLSNVHGAVA